MYTLQAVLNVHIKTCCTSDTISTAWVWKLKKKSIDTSQVQGVDYPQNKTDDSISRFPFVMDQASNHRVSNQFFSLVFNLHNKTKGNIGKALDYSSSL